MTRLPLLAAATAFPALLVTAALPLSTPAHAAPPRRTRPPEPVQRRKEVDPKAYRHEGFFLRLALGPSYQSLQFEGDSDTFEFDGFGLGSSVAIGGVVHPNLAIHADLFAAAMVDPDFTTNGDLVGETSDLSVSLSGLGVGATYYFMPTNLYASLSFGFGTATFEFPGSTADTDSAFALNATVGREFWVAPEWGVGVAGQFTYLDVPNADTGRSVGQYTAFNLLLSATYN